MFKTRKEAIEYWKGKGVLYPPLDPFESEEDEADSERMYQEAVERLRREKETKSGELPRAEK
jgi:hypothetical protein